MLLPPVLRPQVRLVTLSASLGRTLQRAAIEKPSNPECCGSDESCAFLFPGLVLLCPLRARNQLEFWSALAGSLPSALLSHHRYSRVDRLRGCRYLPRISENGRFRLPPQLQRVQGTSQSLDIPNHHSDAVPQP